MATASALHVGLICVAGYLTDRSSTSPTPSPTDQEVARTGTSARERLFTRVARLTAGIVKYATWAGAGCTIAAIVAREYPSATGDAILRKLVLPGLGSAARIVITPMFLAGWTSTTLGTSLRLWCFRTLDRFFTFEVTLKEDHQLCTRGPYSVVRHPAYTGWIMQCTGLAMMNIGAGSWLKESGFLGTIGGQIAASTFIAVEVYMCLSMVHRCSQEDVLMRKRFGDGWLAWAHRVPYRLVPYIF